MNPPNKWGAKGAQTTTESFGPHAIFLMFIFHFFYFHSTIYVFITYRFYLCYRDDDEGG